ncbi:hypothetical protein HYG77_04705 [Rhodococcus sp. ZPP]|uniref:putative phage holin n=1 Tax=Rhodococcus sp. ZPP TaxID=2749906 RepID=UPI001AD87ED0|nr:hypothetical protein [Rhodococcus sp. ZPP]QTJ64966.1 hypothetical protein HYG77_04705 [Rhodococcus sp. ZPP]
MTEAADWALLGVTSMSAVFTMLYLARSPWWRTQLGKIYLSKSVVLTLVLVQNAVAVWISTDYTGRQSIRFAIYLLGAIVYVPMVWSLLLEQQRDRARRRAACEAARRERQKHVPAVAAEDALED